MLVRWALPSSKFSLFIWFLQCFWVIATFPASLLFNWRALLKYTVFSCKNLSFTRAILVLQAPKLCLLIQTILHLHFSSPKSIKNTPDALLFSGKILFPKSILKILPPIPILNCFRFPTSAKKLATSSFWGACSRSLRLLAPQTASRVILELLGSSPMVPGAPDHSQDSP